MDEPSRTLDNLPRAMPVEPPPQIAGRARVIWGAVVGPRIRAVRSLRLTWGLTSVICGAVLATAAYLQPSPSGHGTHEALGMPPCGFYVKSGLPCPTCGMTTSYAYVVRGRLITAFVVQPAGLVFALLTALVMLAGAAIAITGWTIYVDWDRLAVKLMLSLGFVVLLGWGFKLVHGLLMGKLPNA